MSIESKLKGDEGKGWEQYYRVHSQSPPSDLLVRAVEFCEKKEHALDLGAGPLNDSRFLLSKGFDVVAVDQSPLMLERASSIENERFHPVQSSFEDFSFPINKFDIVNASFALPFTSPNAFEGVFRQLKESLVTKGIFSGQLFGIHDTWASNPRMTFHTLEAVEASLADMNILHIEEREREGITAAGAPKHWHVFHIISKRK